MFIKKMCSHRFDHYVQYCLVMHVNHTSHALLKIQYVHASNLGI